MAVVKGGSSVALNFNLLRAATLFDYDFAQVSPTTALYYDNGSNFTRFNGSGFTFNDDFEPLSGTVTATHYVVGGHTVFVFTAVNVPATTVLQHAQAGTTGALLAIALRGNDTITGSRLNDVLRGHNGNDRINGLAGADLLEGGAGNDLMIGGLGKDTLLGGIGADDFDFNSVAEIGRGAVRDVIRDFVHLVDDIDLLTIDANGSAPGNGTFTFLSSEGAAFSGLRGQLRFDQQNLPGTANDRTMVEGDVNGDRVADFQIQLTGIKALTAADFVL